MPNLKCSKCGRINPPLSYTFRDSEISTTCCHHQKGEYVAPLHLDGSELSDDDTDEMLEAETERIRKDVMYDE